MIQENEKTVLTLKHSGGKMVWEGSWDSNLDDIMTGFVGCLRGVSFGEWVIKAIRNGQKSSWVKISAALGQRIKGESYSLGFYCLRRV